MAHTDKKPHRAPTRALRTAGAVGLTVGAAAVAVAVVGLTEFTPTNDGDPAATSSASHGFVFLVVVGLMGLVSLVAGGMGLAAASRFPRVANFSDPIDFLAFLAVVFAFVGSVALIVLAAALYAAVVVVLLAAVLFTTISIRRALAAGEAQVG